MNAVRLEYVRHLANSKRTLKRSGEWNVAKPDKCRQCSTLPEVKNFVDQPWEPKAANLLLARGKRFAPEGLKNVPILNGTKELL